MAPLGITSMHEGETEKYQGVEGWLLVFCLVLTVAVPASTLYRVFGHTLPLLMQTHDPKRETLWAVYAVMFLGVAAMAFVSGMRLWLVRRGAVRMAKLWLLMMLCAHVSYFFLWLVLFSRERTDTFAKVGWDHIVAPLLPFLLWTAYLAHSKRVRDTYREVDLSAGS